MLSSSVTLIKQHSLLLLASFLLYFFSAFGQTIFLGIYTDAIRTDFNLSQTGISMLYAIGTLCSSLVVIWSGKYLDILTPRTYVMLVLCGLAIGCFSLSYTSVYLFLPLSFFLLRHFGQGLMTLSGQTFVNRYIDTGRGRAVSLVSMGMSVHIICLPIVAVWLGQFFDWQTLWLYYGIFIIAILMPLFWFLLHYDETVTHKKWLHSTHTPRQASPNISAHGGTQSATQPEEFEIDHWTRKRVLKDIRFYVLIANMIIPPCFATSIFFYQGLIAQNAGVTPLVFAGAFAPFTLSSITAALISGFIIDKYGEQPILILHPVIYASGLTLLSLAQSTLTLYPAMMLIGFGGGLIGTAGGPLLAKMYGTKHFASIKSLSFSAALLSTSASPLLVGLLLDKGINLTTILFGFVAYCAIVWLLLLPTLRSIKR